MVLCHTPLGSKEFRESLRNKTVIVAGPSERVALKMAKAYGYTQENAITHLTILEYACLFSHPTICYLPDFAEL